MKSVLLALGVLLFGCSTAVDTSSDESPSINAEVGAAVRCASEGGTCRKSACRTNEVSDLDLECGTDAQCCVPVQALDPAATCASVGGTCRKSACRASEQYSERFECGTDAACCVPL